MQRKVRVVVNQGARRCGKASIVPRIFREFSAFDLEIHIPDSYEATVEVCESAARDGVTDLVVVGGDGTINIAVNAIAGTDVRLGIIPSGTANDLATFLGLPKKLADACDRVRKAATRRLDLVDVNGRLYASAGGLGVVSQVATDVNGLKSSSGAARSVVRAFGSLVYVLYSFVLLLFSRKIHTPLEIRVDGKEVGKFKSAALFVNNQPTIGKTVMPCPDARPDDGTLSGLVMRRRSRLGTIFTVILMSLKGSHKRRRDALFFAGEEVMVKSEVPATFIGDGEVLAHTRNLRLAVRPRALRVIA
ncbi:MAG: YegS/Rv2252/BmrU family lipid kinase [Candidatus Sericytochromatia bacterium]|uniref:YegS/Rv2252/BmrU family lipid kinase n=1 Tax=Candidatus Tanganyikabacteria bacterium TaxID=2961651 RepID=A0A937X4T3_9BACT|nr:YegS/Rv2252/BmrU family lipid kinase [Candidatus Tanganyikabacteria bacterium]